jgi:hypothetical protein
MWVKGRIGKLFSPTDALANPYGLCLYAGIQHHISHTLSLGESCMLVELVSIALEAVSVFRKLLVTIDGRK